MYTVTYDIGINKNVNIFVIIIFYFNEFEHFFKLRAMN